MSATPLERFTSLMEQADREKFSRLYIKQLGSEHKKNCAPQHVQKTGERTTEVEMQPQC